ncbi:MAG TPA: hypothetical protein VKB86_00260 [Pyrinomonadaceae bacterium]|nr:hypothetical protein [Pyrinomonadaceae bacterium]
MQSLNQSTSTRKPNSGQFKKGFDARRHQLTQADRSKGFWSAMATMGVSIGQKLHNAGRWPQFQGRRAS